MIERSFKANKTLWLHRVLFFQFLCLTLFGTGCFSALRPLPSNSGQDLKVFYESAQVRIDPATREFIVGNGKRFNRKGIADYYKSMGDPLAAHYATYDPLSVFNGSVYSVAGAGLLGAAPFYYHQIETRNTLLVYGSIAAIVGITRLFSSAPEVPEKHVELFNAGLKKRILEAQLNSDKKYEPLGDLYYSDSMDDERGSMTWDFRWHRFLDLELLAIIIMPLLAGADRIIHHY